MEIQRARELLKILADGIDPLTGEVLPEDHVCNKGEIVRALHCVLEEQTGRSGKQVVENAGKPWTRELDGELLRLYDEGVRRKELCVRFGRTRNAIESRLKKLGRA